MLIASVAEHHTQVLLALFLMLAAAKLMAELFERIGQPSVVGEILAGVLLGPSLLGWVQPSAVTGTLAELGAIFLLFSVGLETKPAAILRVGKTALNVALLGIVVPLAAGWALMRARGTSHIEAVFVGTALVATSVGITARVLSGLGVMEAPASRIILGAAVIDDVLGLLVLAVVSAFAAGSVNYVAIGATAVCAIGFTLFVTFVGGPVVTRLAPRVRSLQVTHAPFFVALLLGLGLSVAASSIGIAAIIGAFLAGMAMAEAAEGKHAFHQQVSGITELLTPFFLVSIGLQLRMEVFRSPAILGFSLLLTAVALATKFFGCGAAALSLGRRTAAQVGIGMMPRGEVGIVVAQLGLGLGVFNDELFAMILFMAVATTLAAPPLLKIAFRAPQPLEGVKVS